MTNRNVLIVTGAVLLALVVVVIAVVLTLGNPVEQGELDPVVPESADEGVEAPEEGIRQQIEVVIFLQSPRRPDRLVPVKRSIFNTISIDQQAGQVLQKLIQGPAPAEGLLPTIPEGAALQKLYLAEDGTAFVAFNRVLLQRHGGGTSGELATVYSIVNSLCVNFPSIQRVQLLVDGVERETLAGHIDISRPLILNADLFVTTTQAPERQPEADEPEPSL
jgi:hypothetical protein